jgi:D-alanine-D-alanine ligase
VSERIRVAVIAGGRSSEHEISLASARSVLAALDPTRYEVVTVGIGRDGRWALSAGDPRRLVESGQVQGSDPGTRPAETLPVPQQDGGGPLERLGTVDVALPILHGPFGEDGTVQGLLELADVPYVGAGVAASALCMDKDLFKKVMRDSGIPVARHHALREGDPVGNPFGYPVFVKPARLGSSIGITKVYEEARLADAVALARRHDDKVLVEEFVPGMEVECSVLGNRQPPPVASLPGRIDTLSHDWYDWSSKYDEGEMELVVPPELPQETIERVQELAVAAFVASECEGLARVDFFVRDGGEVIVNELNTMPGFTATSVYAKLFEASGIPYAELLDRLIALALERAERRRKLVY